MQFLLIRTVQHAREMVAWSCNDAETELHVAKSLSFIFVLFFFKSH